MYSLRDSIIRPDELVNRLKEIGQDAVAITDHGESLGGISIYKKLKENGIKYIHGCELYVCPDASVKEKGYFHLVALCKNEQGRINLNRLITLSEDPSHFYYKPRIDFEMLSQYGDGLIITSACLAGEIDKLIMSDDLIGARVMAAKYKERFGEDYFLEIQAHRDEEQIKVNKQVVTLAQELNIPCVVTCDAHYVYESDKKYQNKYAFNGSYKEDGEAYIDCFVQSEAEVRDRISYLPQEIIDKCVENTRKIAEKCDLEMPLSAPIMPKMAVPTKYKDSKDWLNTLCVKGFEQKLNIDYNKKTIANPNRKLQSPRYDEEGNFLGYIEYQLSNEQVQEYIKRYEYELDSLARMGFIDYILLVYSYANVGKRRGIARGSGGGSLINYLTNITDIDPIEHGLYFERFIDVGALDLLESGEITAKELKIPDIDLDFSGESCKDVLHYLYDTYGEEKVASIGKFGTNQTKGTIRDMCKVLGIDLQTADKIAKAFENYEIEEIDMMISGEIPVAASAKEPIQYVKKYTELFEYVRKLNGLPKSFGLHACGKVIATKDLDCFLPSSYDSDGIRYLQGDMHDVEDVGLVKIDVLGLRTLDQEYDTLEMSNQTKEFINPKQSFKDKKVLDVFRNGDTVGIFQFSSAGMKQTLKKMDVQGIDDLSIANALFRPGSMAYIDNFCRRRKGQEKFEYLHPDLEPILKSTYGIIVFQEQLIEIGRMAGLHNPDMLRKATAKKKAELLNVVKPELKEKLMKRGWTEAQFDKLWSDMIEFSKYSFNKAHSSAYGILAYMTAKQKAYYPAEFFAGLCNSFMGKSSFAKDDAEEIMEDVYDHKIKMAPFSFRNDHRECSVKDGELVYGIPLIKSCNQNAADTLYEMGQKDWSSFTDILHHLIKNQVPRNQIEVLIKLGFFSEFENSRKLLKFYNLYQEYSSKKTYKKELIDGTWAEPIFKEYTDGLTASGKESKTYAITNTHIKEQESILKGTKKVIKGYETKHEEVPKYLISTKERLENEISELVEQQSLDLLKALEKQFMTFDIPDFSFKEKIATQQEFLGFVNLTTGKKEDVRNLLVVKKVPMKNKESGDIWGYALFTSSVGSGKKGRITVKSKVYEADPINVMDIIYVGENDLFKNSKGYWYLNNYTKII